MQLIAILGVLVAVNLGIVYVGSEATEENQPQAEGVVEVETVEAQEPDTSVQESDTTEKSDAEPK
ncbi:hypothetical protein FT643_13145 [Ketobacter sp. MCCC 1A13808]|uniref:hypothetical protein n=1 Tax=Ketobacter sp. MCCC 1A13808 TaxID=2602738 RepID=UPI000F161BAA|nr:hypothetical protein [Ketobacter sp. MCCC 1A13808]MVF13083.1 hypothetical protein [Ketobacter sp. MCCC 1A13808]RLP53007.1 MAG: hypothetical protein D6160_17925 [Ketobacter sp.]